VTSSRDNAPDSWSWRRLEARDGGRVGQLVAVNRRLRRRRARLRHRFKHLAFLRRETLHRRDEVGNEVGAPLVLALDLRPRGLRGLLAVGTVLMPHAASASAARMGNRNLRMRITPQLALAG